MAQQITRGMPIKCDMPFRLILISCQSMLFRERHKHRNIKSTHDTSCAKQFQASAPEAPSFNQLTKELNGSVGTVALFYNLQRVGIQATVGCRHLCMD